MDEISRKFFPGQYIPPSVDEDLEEMAGYSVKFVQNRKVYESGDQTLVVWSKEMCIKKLAKAITDGDVTTVFAAGAAWVAEQTEKGQMFEKWAGDCYQKLEKVWEKFGYDVVNMVEQPAEPQPEPTAPPPKKLGLFKRST